MFFNFLTLTDNECMFCCTGNECPNVTVHWMTQYVAYNAAAIWSSRHIKSKFLYYGPTQVLSQVPVCSCGYKKKVFIVLLKLVQSLRDISNRFSTCYQQIRGFPRNNPHEWIDSMSAKWNLLTSEKVVIAWKWASKWIYYFNKLVSCKIWGKKKIYICYVLYMVCIVFVKINQTMFYRKTFLYEDVWKDGRDPTEKEIRLYIKIFAYSTALSG